MKKIDCQTYAQRILNTTKYVVSHAVKRKSLVIFTAGNDSASEAYVKGKMKDCEKCGIECINIYAYNQKDLLRKIQVANVLGSVGGIIVQLPLPKDFNEDEAVNAVSKKKDVDGFKSGSPFKPCTPEGIMFILKNEVGSLEGKSALVIGKGKLVGKPVVDLLLDAGCTVTVAHSRTKDLEELLKTHHDIVVTGVGKQIVDLSQTNADVVIDAGITRNEDGKLCGDCFNFNDTGDGMKVTTVPNGIGLMTRAMLMNHMGEVMWNG